MYYFDYYKVPGIRHICRSVKQTESETVQDSAISTMAVFFADKILTRHKNHCDKAIIIPIPQHTGYAEYTKEIAKRVGDVTGAKILDILKAEPRESFYSSKKKETIESFEFAVPSIAPVLELEKGFKSEDFLGIYLLDNVIATGNTFKKALSCLSDLVPTPDYNKDLSACSLLEKIARAAFFRNINPLVYGIDSTRLSLSMAKELGLFYPDTSLADDVVLYGGNS